MHNVLTRGNSLLAFTLWVMAGVTAACFLTTVFLDYTTPTKLEVKDIKLRTVVDYATDERKVDLATLAFDLEVDFTKIFNWNVKQLFVYLVAEYKSRESVVNQVVLWDQIVERAERVVLNEKGKKTKYYFIDNGNSLLKHKNVSFSLRYNVIPNSGYLRLVQSAEPVTVEFPTQYSITRR
ncbi:unnamed protein product [Caenorhabditis sp. 36 PRJEB53466]|nr:unnamed protein product [Caenorhabditis sp. 36 PRJEB53466]